MHDRLERNVKRALALKAVPNQGKLFNAEYATAALKVRKLISPALVGPRVSDSLLSREDRQSAIQSNELMAAETLRSYPLKMRP